MKLHTIYKSLFESYDHLMTEELLDEVAWETSKEQKLKDLENSFEWHKLLITDSKTHMKPAAEVAPVADTVPAPPTRNDISKIEVVHTLEEMNKVPDFLVQKDTKK